MLYILIKDEQTSDDIVMLMRDEFGPVVPKDLDACFGVA